MSTEKQKKEKLIKYLSFVRDNEASKPLAEMDNDLIDASVGLLLDLQDKKVTLSDDEVREKVRKIPFADTESVKTVTTKGKQKLKHKKILLIAAILAILLAILTFSTIADDFDIHSIIEDRFGSAVNAPIGEVVDENGQSFINVGSIRNYTSVEEFYKAEKINIMSPKKLPDGITVEGIDVTGDKDDISIIYIFSEKTLNYDIIKGTSLFDDVKETYTEITTVNGIECYIEDLSDVGICQISFMNNGYHHTFIHNDKQFLLNIIENLEELK